METDYYYLIAMWFICILHPLFIVRQAMNKKKKQNGDNK